jgi:hypothetical protein
MNNFLKYTQLSNFSVKLAISFDSCKYSNEELIFRRARGAGREKILSGKKKNESLVAPPTSEGRRRVAGFEWVF